jgi:hypothetical protein
MTNPVSHKIINVSSTCTLEIDIEQLSQNESQNTSYVNVRGWIKNTGSSRITHAGNITAQITGEQEWIGNRFGYDLSPGESYEFIQHSFNLVNNSDGTKTTSFTVGYGITGTSQFGDNRQVSNSLTLTRIPKRPGRPGPILFTNIHPTSITLSWTAATDNGGKAITSYLLRRWNSTQEVGSHIDSNGLSLSRTITGLQPGANYTFQVYAYNGVIDNNGYSNSAADTVITMLAGAYIRVGGAWKIAVPYIRTGGAWKLAVPYIRSNGAWKLTD